MAYIQPNSRIEFFDDIGISQDYNDTLYFPSVSAKDTYFDNITRLAHVDRCYYARENRGFVRVELPMSTMIHAQYMRFKNTSYENKWWYAFVDNVNYINDNTTEVQFTLDPMLTWMGEFHPRACFVERQHSTVDYIGCNIIPEPVTYNDPVIRARNMGSITGSFGVCLFMAHHDVAWIDPSLTMALYQPQIVGGIYNGLDMVYCGTPQALDFVLQKLITEVWIEDVVAIKMLPMNFAPPASSIGALQHVDYSANKPYTDISGYTPKNKKLFTYPYNYVKVNNSEGQENIYKYELFGQVPPNQNNYTTFSFTAYGAWNSDMELILVPNSYNGSTYQNYEERMSMQDFPSCSWNVDTFKAMLAQKESNLPARLLSSALSTVATSALQPATTKHAASIALSGGVNAVTDILASKILPPNMPTIVKGSQGCNPLFGFSPTQKDFVFSQMNINAEDARIIDNYFTMFGYADNTVHEPNMNARQRFTYVKTIDCKIDCRCPASDADKIEEIFNRGIRFWKDHTQIGNYTDDNLPYATSTPTQNSNNENQGTGGSGTESSDPGSSTPVVTP